jgi:hypothetical protein
MPLVVFNNFLCAVNLGKKKLTKKQQVGLEGL